MDTNLPAVCAQQSDMHPLVALLLVLVLIGLMALIPVAAMSANWRAGESLRARYLREKNIAEAYSLDLPAIKRGREEFLTSCTACHGPNGEAKPKLGKDLRHSKFIASQSDGQLVMFLQLGRNTWEPENTTGVAMPPKGGNPMLTNDNLADIVQYLRFLQADAQTP